MKPFRLFVCVIFVTTCGFAAASSWRYGRIIQIRKSVNSRAKAWVVNTPIIDEVTVYTIWVHLENSVLTGTYELSSENSAPPPEWTTKYAVKVQVQGDTMYVVGPTAYVRLHITKREPAAEMLPLTKEEKKVLADLDGPPQESMIGFSKESRAEAQSEKPAEPAAAPPPAPKPANSGTITVRSTPYLSEVFVDGESMGYTPAKINLASGKHTFRVEKVGYKAWSKELTLTVGSELTLDATLEKR